MPETIEAKQLQLNDIFNDNYLFEIPEYQRPYAWTTEQVSELIDDLSYAMGKGEKIDEVPPYFLGSIVIIKDPISKLARIVDGQQRITTITILFCVLRELSAEEDRDLLDRYVREQSNRFASVEGRFRLSVRERDRDFFQDNVQNMGALPGFLEHLPAELPDSQQRMFENTKYLWDNLSKLGMEQLDRLTQFLVLRCYLVIVSASDQSSAYRIFSVMNDRGLDLSPTDILKAEIIGAMDESVRPQYTEKWEDTEEDLGRDGFRDLFAHIRMIYKKDKARGSLNQEFRDDVLEQVKDKNFIDEVLTPYADTYEIVTRADYKGTDDAKRIKNINLYLEHLGRLDNSDWVPPAMMFFKQNLNKTDSLHRFIRDLERLAYGMFVKRANVTERVNRYADILKEVEKDGDLFEDTSRLQLNPEEKTEILKALEGPIYLTTRVRRPLLLRLDNLLADEGAEYHYSTISIEHVLPQNPASDSEWMAWFPNEEERAQWTHKLANLVLLSFYKNVSAQNYEFEKKKSKYFQKKSVAPFALTMQVLNESAWTPKVLEQRQRSLVDALKEEWRLG